MSTGSTPPPPLVVHLLLNCRAVTRLDELGRVLRHTSLHSQIRCPPDGLVEPCFALFSEAF